MSGIVQTVITAQLNNDYPASPEARDPPPFPEPHFNPCRRINIPGPRLRYTTQGDELEPFVLEPVASSNTADARTPIAYWTRSAIRGTISGVLLEAVVVKPRLIPSSDEKFPLEKWEVVQPLERVAIQVILRTRIDALRRGGVAKDPWKEVAAMQYLKNHFHPQLHDPNNIETTSSSLEAFVQAKEQALELMENTRLMMVLDALSDDEDNLYVIMPFCGGGDLFDLMNENRHQPFTEEQCRPWMKHILVGIEKLQMAGVCHRNISLEALMTDSTHDGIFVIDMGQALRVPIADGQRHLIPFHGHYDKQYTTQPEIIEEASYDGYAADLWAVGVVLLDLLTGQRPIGNDMVRMARIRGREIAAADFERMVTDSLNGVNVSPEAVNLLQQMLRWDPKDRLSLQQTQDHAWMKA